MEERELIFDMSSVHWMRNMDHNRLLVQSTMNYMNHLLVGRRFVFLNQVREAFGLPWTTEGQLLGWTIEHGRGFIDYRTEDDVENGSIKITLLVQGPIHGYLDILNGGNNGRG